MKNALNGLPEPTKIHVARFRFLLRKLLTRERFNDFELPEYHKLSSLWTILYNARRRGIELTPAQLALSTVKSQYAFTRNVRQREYVKAQFLDQNNKSFR